MDDTLRALHDEAVRAGRQSYRDPATGFRVFTELAHLRRGTCCGNGCRHCPYGHLEVPGGRSRADAPWWQLAGPPDAEALDLISWSGGKDALLALRRLEPVGRRALFTTYDPVTGVLPVQGVSIDGVRAQAAWLGLDLLAVPLSTEDYVERTRHALGVADRRAPVRRIAFGDLHLADVRAWRERTWSDRALAFPVWGASPGELLDELERSGVRVVISASAHEAARPGAIFDRAFVRGLPDGVDPFGENGEFHTYVVPGPPGAGRHLVGR